MQRRPRSCRASAGSIQATIRQKSEAIDLVTEADEAGGALHQGCGGGALAGRAVRGRGIGGGRPGAARQARQADLAIVVDPVDGTANFAAGLPLFATMAAVV
jgi:fructose-1,6-bisphosphatase/inositol monophosphatase family enzyme